MGCLFLGKTLVDNKMYRQWVKDERLEISSFTSENSYKQVV